MEDTGDDYKCNVNVKRAKDAECKRLKRKEAKERQIPKIQKENEEYSVEKALGKRFGKKGTIGKNCMYALLL